MCTQYSCHALSSRLINSSEVRIFACLQDPSIQDAYVGSYPHSSEFWSISGRILTHLTLNAMRIAIDFPTYALE